jgi:hypothetical protein
MSPHKRNMKNLGAFSAISTDIGLIKVDSRCHPTAGAQPDQTVEGRKTMDPDHGKVPKAQLPSHSEYCQ